MQVLPSQTAPLPRRLRLPPLLHRRQGTALISIPCSIPPYQLPHVIPRARWWLTSRSLSLPPAARSPADVLMVHPFLSLHLLTPMAGRPLLPLPRTTYSVPTMSPPISLLSQ